MSVEITVILPTHNRRESLLRAIETVRRQTRAPLETIVVADGCTDGSVEAVRELGHEGLEVLDLPKGPGKGWGNRNEALELARGDVVAYLSDDDLWLPDHLERVGAVWDCLAPDLVQASSCLVGPDGELSVFAMDWGEGWSRQRLLAGTDSRTPMSAVSHRRALVAEAGGWSEHPDGPGDLDLWKRMILLDPHTEIVRDVTVIFMPASAVHTGGRVEHARVRAARQADILERISTPRDLTVFRQRIARADFREQASSAEREQRLRADRDQAHEYIRSLQAELATRRAGADEASAYAASLEREVVKTQGHAAALAGDLHAARERERELRGRLDDLEREAGSLRERAHTLSLIEAGGWWRLRRRIDPLVRAVRRMRPRAPARRPPAP